MQLYRSASELDFGNLAYLPVMLPPRRVLMVEPSHFDVLYVINPHMAAHVGQVDRQAARRQWEALKQAYERIDVPVEVLRGEPGLPDMVFCANQSLPFLDDRGFRQVWMSLMHAAQRQLEVHPIEVWYRGQGYQVVHFQDPSVTSFEGMGDAIWHPGRRLLWGGYGFRSSLAAYREIARRWGVPVLALELCDPDFYHLDTCLCALNETTALIYRGAFTAEGLELLNRVWPTLIEAPEEEARAAFACNAHCPDGAHVLLPSGAPVTCERLERAGFRVQTLDTGEFLKSGGSIFCLKMMVY